jgi:prolyl 4-hydroxylase
MIWVAASVLGMSILGGIIAYYLWWVPAMARRHVSRLAQETFSSEVSVKRAVAFLDDREIAFFKRIGAARLRPSRVHYGRNSDPEMIRTSYSTIFPQRFNFHPVFHRIRCRAAALFDLSPSQIENLQLCRYQDTQEFSLHSDFFEDSRTFPKAAGERVATVLVYLNDLAGEGGQTLFPKLNLSIQPEKGSAVYWFNVKEDGAPDYRTLHAAAPVSGPYEKWIMNIWIRERALLPHYLRRFWKKLF